MIAGIPINQELIEKLQEKLNGGNLRSIQLNCLPGRVLSRLDLCDLELVRENLSKDFIGKLFNHTRKFSFDVSFNTLDFNIFDDDKQKQLGVLAKRLNHLAIQNKEDFQEYGYESFGFGFPIVVFRPEKAPNKIVRAPLFIWRLSIEKNFKNTNSWKISRKLDQEIQYNDLLRSYLADVNDLNIEGFNEDELDDSILDEEEILQNTIRFLQVFTNDTPESELGRKLKDGLQTGPNKLPGSESLNAIVSTIPKVYWSGIFGRFIQRNEAIKKELREKLPLLISDSEDDEDLRKVDSFSHAETGIDTDPSQLGILNYLQNNEHLIIQGPPGTGKSRTITGIILNALELGKRTLVVCEKKTAMEVLKNNLNEISPHISELVGVVDDVSRDRKQIVNSVRDRCERSVPNAFLTKLQSNIGIRLGFIEKRIEEIHDRKLFLHNEPILKDDEIEIPWNKVVGRFLQAKLHNGDQSLRNKLEDNGFSIDEFQLGDTNNSLKSLEEKSQKVTHKDLLRFLSDGAIKNENPSNLRRQLNALLEKNLDDLDTFIHKYDDHLTKTKAKLFKRIDKQIKEIDSLVHNLEELLNKLNTQRLFQKRDWRFSIANMLSHISKNIRENVETFNKIPDVLQDLQNKSLEIDLKLFNEDIPDTIPKFIDWRNYKEKELNSLIESLIVIKHQLLNKLSDQSILNICIDEDILSEFKKRVIQFSKYSKSDKIKYKFRSADIRDLIEAKKALSAFFEVSNAFLEADNDGFLNHLSWQTTFREQTNNLKELIKLFQQENVGDWHIQFEEFFLNELLSEKIDLNRSSGYDSELKSLEEEREKLRKDIAQRIPHIWFYEQTHLRPKLPMPTLYNKRGAKGHRRNSLRKIIKTDFKTFTAYYPVVMVNPSVCASIIPLQPELFDLVIFDEASQLKVEESLSTLIRGKRKIVSGDKNQMPPSYWFTSNGSDEMTLEDEIDDNSDDATLERYVQNETTQSLADSESLLEFAEYCDFKQYYLDFHYRSRHPLLIQFSNAAFYKNRLYPLPERIPNPPIQFFRINGLYEHRQNKQEAEAVISILKQLKRDKDGKLPSVGIATFNLQQRNFIWDLIKREVQIDKEFQKRFTELEDDGLFIKNLENIQGDERDIIIISTTFGIRSDGRYTANYGPLTRKGIGRRLLNVIITRAKMKVFVLTSIPEERCLNYKEELSGSNIVEGGYLHAYLCYAKAVSEDDTDTIKSILEFLNQSEGDHSINNFTTESPFEDAVMEALLSRIPEERIVTQYRAGGFRIDIAIRSNKTGKPYIAIECDGATYHGSMEDYAWDIYRQKRLEEHGFVFHRIWSRDWWENSDRELDKLIKFIQRQDSKEIQVESKRDPVTEHLQLDTTLNLNGNGKVYEEQSEKESIDLKVIHRNEIPNRVLNTTEESHNNDNGYLKNDGALIKIGSKVKVKYLDNNKKVTFKILHGDHKYKKNNGYIVVSESSPIGVAALGRKVGDKFEINGLERYCEILEVN